MNRTARQQGVRGEPRYSRLRAALVLGGLAAFGAVGTAAIYKKAEDDTARRANAEIVQKNVPCELTGEAVPASGRAGFALKARCPDGGTAYVRPTLSLWTRLIEATPSENKTVACIGRRNGSYTDCRKPDATFASR